MGTNIRRWGGRVALLVMVGAGCHGNHAETSAPDAGGGSDTAVGSSDTAADTSGGGSDTRVATSQLVGPAGGQVADPSGTAVDIPAGALSGMTTIGVAPVEASGAAAGMPGLPPGLTAVGDIFALTPHGVAFAVPATVHVVYDPARAATATGALRLYTASADGSWAAVGGATPAAGSVDAEVTHFSFFVVGFESPGQVLTEPHGRKLDLLFMIDNSLSMQPLQQKLALSFPTLIQVLKDLPGGLPDLHIGVISSSMGAGQFDSIPDCAVGGDGGRLQFAPTGTCTQTGLHDNFIAAGENESTKNYDGTIEDTFSCIALIGDRGCGFEHQLESVATALGANGPVPPENAGFLRPDALLAIVLVTNEDDCSAPPNAQLFDPMSLSVSDPFGPLQSYRCNEFGHLCRGAPPPRTMAADFAPGECVPAEGAGLLIPVATLLSQIKGLKFDPSQILVSVIGGPPDPYGVTLVNAQTGTTDATNGVMWPNVNHSCVQNTGEYGDPAVRLAAFVQGFGGNGTFLPICADSFAPALTGIGASLAQAVGPLCLQSAVVSAGSPPALKAGCTVFESVPAADGTRTETVLPTCGGAASPCWTIGAEPTCAAAGASITVTRTGTAPPGAAVVIRCQP